MGNRPDDTYGAFCRENHVSLRGSGAGPLRGLRFAVKDVFHVAGHRTGFGNPTWLATHPPATHTSVVIDMLLAAGADMAGKTVTDELAYSLTGENVHYGTPCNPRDPRRVPGGSSSGSAVAVAVGAVDFTLGTDCGGSVRIPASYCGILGIRSSSGRIPLTGVIPFGPSFDALGWFARDPRVLRAVGEVLLPPDGLPLPPPRSVLIARDAFDLVGEPVRTVLRMQVERLCEAVGRRPQEVTLSAEGLEEWMNVFQVIQAAEIWANHGAWIRSANPCLGPGIRERFERAASVVESDVTRSRELRKSISARVDALLQDGAVLCMPTSPRVAPLRGTPLEDIEVTYRNQAMCLLCVAGLAGLPQLSLPMAELDGLPLGLSVLGRSGADRMLLELAVGLLGREPPSTG